MPSLSPEHLCWKAVNEGNRIHGSGIWKDQKPLKLTVSKLTVPATQTCPRDSGATVPNIVVHFVTQRLESDTFPPQLTLGARSCQNAGSAVPSATGNYLLQEIMPQTGSKSRIFQMSALQTLQNTASARLSYQRRTLQQWPDGRWAIPCSLPASAAWQGCKTTGNVLSRAHSHLTRHVFGLYRSFLLLSYMDRCWSPYLLLLLPLRCWE